ncbi:MAG: gluconate 2-dehydrogenase subunit 3 family protein [Cyclobacteriaceae bacterium]
MDRREALKNITLSTGSVISAGTFISLLQSCQKVETIQWVPAFFNNEEAVTVNEIVNIIIPASDTPGAIDVAVPQFIDLLLKDVFDEDVQSQFRNGIVAFTKKFKAEKSSDFIKSSQEDQQSFVESLYNLSNDKADAILKLVKAEEAPAGKEEDYTLYKFLVSLRDLTIKSYFSSEKVGEEILTYDPIPGRQEGCVPVEEVGNVYSL